MRADFKGLEHPSVGHMYNRKQYGQTANKRNIHADVFIENMFIDFIKFRNIMKHCFNSMLTLILGMPEFIRTAVK
jgi:hypothetical protein